MNKKDREIIFNKYDGKCAYCGCELTKGWHADHMSPVHRLRKSVGGNWVTKDTGVEPTEQDIINGNHMVVPRKTIPNGFHKPHNDVLENMMPSCPSCNIYKHSADLETFRRIISNGPVGLNKQSAQYRFGKRFGLIKETGIDVKFYFETLTSK